MLPEKLRSSVTAFASFRWLRTVDETFAKMLSAIRQAGLSVRLEMYIYTESAIGEAFREALVQACQRGVAVRVLVDAWGSMTLSDRFWDPLRQAGGEFQWFNPLQFRCCGFRNHRKLLICDEESAFLGGFNIAAEYQGDGVTRGWCDLGLEIRGRLAGDLATTFDYLFHLADIEHKRFTPWRKAACRNILSTYDGQVLLGGPGRGQNFFKRALLSDFAASEWIQIICPYFLPARPLRRMLMRRARQGAKVQLILAGKTDVPLAQMAARGFYSALLRAGVEVYEYQPQVLHAKLIATENVVYIGSANLDRRSFYINYEMMLRLSDAALVREAHEIFARDLEFCRRIEPRVWRKSRTLSKKLLERFAIWVLARIDPTIARWQLQYFLKPNSRLRRRAVAGRKRPGAS